MKKRFDPQHDITAYELAVIFANVSTGMGEPLVRQDTLFDEAKWNELPDEIKRHWR